MDRTLAKYGDAVTVFLGLMVAVNASHAVPSGDRSAARGDTRPLLMAQAQQIERRKIFHAVGIVTAIEPSGSLTINHEPIEGLMPAMEMMFKVNPPTLTKNVRPGDKVDFSVEGKTFVIVGLKVTGHTK